MNRPRTQASELEGPGYTGVNPLRVLLIKTVVVTCNLGYICNYENGHLFYDWNTRPMHYPKKLITWKVRLVLVLRLEQMENWVPLSMMKFWPKKKNTKDAKHYHGQWDYLRRMCVFFLLHLQRWRLTLEFKVSLLDLGFLFSVQKPLQSLIVIYFVFLALG